LILITVPSKAVVIVVASFLLAILIYSAVAQFDVSARKPKQINNFCNPSTPTISGAVKAETCCQAINGVYTFCIKCQYDANDNTVGSCISFYPNRLAANSTALPAQAGGELPPPSNNTGPPPLGSIFKVPPGTTSANPPSGNTTGGPVVIMSSDNPPGCSKQNPIPPNCTINPFPSSGATSAQVPPGLFKPAGNITNAPIAPKNSTLSPPTLKLSPQTGLPQVHHHHKGGSTSSSNTNSTGH
jgi:hypothetical protein